MSSKEAARADILTPDSAPYERALFKCRMAEGAERFDDMVEFIKEACKTTSEPLGPNERNYLSVAYKNFVGTRRNALRCLAAMKLKYESRQAPENLKLVSAYYDEVLAEVEKTRDEVQELIDLVVMRDEVVSGLKDDRAAREFKVFCLKMKADYCRYYAEFAEGEKRKSASDEAGHLYQLATEAACVGPDDVILPPPHPVRLGLNLNYSVFLYEIQERCEEAKKLAKQAFDDALDKLDSTGDVEYKDSTAILQLLRDNTTLWSNNEQDPAAQQGAEEKEKETAI